MADSEKNRWEIVPDQPEENSRWEVVDKAASDVEIDKIASSPGHPFVHPAPNFPSETKTQPYRKPSVAEQLLPEEARFKLVPKPGIPDLIPRAPRQRTMEEYRPGPLPPQELEISGRYPQLASPGAMPKIEVQREPSARDVTAVMHGGGMGATPTYVSTVDDPRAEKRAAELNAIEQSARHEGIVLASGARGYPEAAHAITDYPTKEEMETPSWQMTSGRIGKALDALMKIATPAFIAGGGAATAQGPAAMARFAGWQVAGMGAAELAGTGAEKAGLPKEVVEPIKTLAFFVPGAIGAHLALRGGSIRTPVTFDAQGRPISGEAVGGFVKTGGGGMGAAAVKTPGEYAASLKVGETRFGVRIPRGPQETAGALEGEVVSPGTPAPPKGDLGRATAALQTKSNIEALTRRIANVPGSPPPPTPATPAVPMVTQATTGQQSEDFGNEIRPEDVQTIGVLITSLPPELRGQAITEAHQNLAGWLEQKGTVVGPDGKIAVVKGPDQAQKLAAKWINEQVDRIDQEQETQAAQAAVAAEQAAAVAAQPQGVSAARATAEKIRVASERIAERKKSAAEVKPEAQAAAGVEPAAKGEAVAPPKFEKGQQVILKGGEVATVEYVHPSLPLLRARTAAGKKVTVNRSKVQPLEPETVEAKREGVEARVRKLYKTKAAFTDENSSGDESWASGGWLFRDGRVIEGGHSAVAADGLREKHDYDSIAASDEQIRKFQNATGAIRVLTGEGDVVYVDLSSRPSEKQLRNIADLLRSGTLQAHLVGWEFYSPAGKRLEYATGSIADFQRAIDKAWPEEPSELKAKRGQQVAGTVEAAARDTTLFQQARKELGEQASVSDVAKRAQELKTQREPEQLEAKRKPDLLSQARKIFPISKQPPRQSFIAPDGTYLSAEENDHFAVEELYKGRVEDEGAIVQFVRDTGALRTRYADGDFIVHVGDKAPTEEQLSSLARAFNEYRGLITRSVQVSRSDGDGDNYSTAPGSVNKTLPAGTTAGRLRMVVADLFGEPEQLKARRAQPKAYQFLSPNVHELQGGVKQALERQRAGSHKDFLELSRWIDQQLGLAGESRSAIGAWKGGAENSVLVTSSMADGDTIRFAALLKALLGDQKYALWNVADPQGKDRIYTFPVPWAQGTAQEVSAELAKSGLESHTLVDAEDSHQVVLSDSDVQDKKAYFESVQQAARALGVAPAQVRATRVRGALEGRDALAEAKEYFRKELAGIERRRPDFRRVHAGSESSKLALDLSRSHKAEALAVKYGTTENPKEAGWILRDGTLVPLQGTHDAMLGSKPTENARVDIIQKSGIVRTRFRQGRAGDEIVFSLPEEGVSEAQARQVRAAAAVVPNGRIVLEQAHEAGGHRSLDFPTAGKLQAALVEMGAVKPEEQDTLEAKRMSPEERRSSARRLAGYTREPNDSDLGFVMQNGDFAGVTDDLVSHPSLAGVILSSDYTPNALGKFLREYGAVRLEIQKKINYIDVRYPPTRRQVEFLASISKGKEVAFDVGPSRSPQTLVKQEYSGNGTFADFQRAIDKAWPEEPGTLEAKRLSPEERAAAPSLDKEALTADERAILEAPSRRIRYMEVKRQLPPVEEVMNLVRAGKVGLPWYDIEQTAYEAMSEVAPHLFPAKTGEKQRFIGLVAAFSPQQPNPRAHEMAVEYWVKWNEAGRPTDKPALDKIFLPIRRMPTWAKNARRALLGENLSGLKVWNFSGNLMGVPYGVTLDAWMALPFGIDPARFGDPATYFAVASRVREAAQKLGVEPRQAQAAIWVFTKTLVESAGYGGGREMHALDQVAPLVDEDLMRQHGSDLYEVLLRHEGLRSTMKEAGVDLDRLDQAVRERQAAHPQSAEVGQPAEPVSQVSARRIEETLRTRDRAREGIERKVEPGELFPEEPGDMAAKRMPVGADLARRYKKFIREPKSSDVGYVSPAGEFIGVSEGGSEKDAEQVFQDAVGRNSAIERVFSEESDEVLMARRFPALAEARANGIEPLGGSLENLAPTFFSKAERVADEKLPNQILAAAVLPTLRNNGVKESELEWLGLDDFLKGKGKVPKQEVLGFIRQNNVQLQDVVKSGNPGELAFLENVGPDGSRRWVSNEGGYQYFIEQDAYNKKKFYAEESSDNSRVTIHEIFKSIAAAKRWFSEMRAERGGDLKFAQYTLPGGENHRELLLWI